MSFKTARENQMIANNLAEHIVDNADKIYVSFHRKNVPQSIRWCMIFQDFFLKKAQDNRLTAMNNRVLDYMMGSTDFENYVMVTTKKIAECIRVDDRRVKESIKALKEYGYIEVKKYGRNNIYRLNPDMIWKGKYKKRAENIIEFPAH